MSRSSVQDLTRCNGEQPGSLSGLHHVPDALDKHDWESVTRIRRAAEDALRAVRSLIPDHDCEAVMTTSWQTRRTAPVSGRRHEVGQ